ncbi:unnamed protein product [Blepharisma stoltei]|uniref:Uncharacterized protein n=1 Tax=Blepharisma stoltei TaxID=1481888 RepID=A0AAU9JTY9_9CILI|nr:unnamed protein product [Blepharisma stoltei]
MLQSEGPKHISTVLWSGSMGSYLKILFSAVLKLVRSGMKHGDLPAQASKVIDIFLGWPEKKDTSRWIPPNSIWPPHSF